MILAGISITALTGNGIFERAKQSKIVHIKAEMKERLILEISELQVEKKGNANLDDITEDWVIENLKDYEGVLINSSSEDEKKIKMKKNGVTQVFTIDLNLNIREDESTEFSYEEVNREGDNVDIKITVRDGTNGINRIELPGREAIICNGDKEEIKLDYVVEIGIEYKVKIVLENGDEKEEIILINPDIQVSEPIIGISTTSTESVNDNTQTRGTKLYINFSATLGGQACIIEPAVPYEITKNGTYKFSIKGIYKDKTITKEIEVQVKKYKSAPDLVQYDAGDWTKEEIEELQNLTLYDLNSAHNSGVWGPKLSVDSYWGLTFGGFTYKGDTENEKIEGIITNRNKSTWGEGGPYPYNGFLKYPTYEGWQILESEEKEGKKYVKKIVHAGVPENFTFIFEAGGGYRAEYLLTGIAKDNNEIYKKTSNGININVRNWDMYRDKELDKKGYIENVHCMSYDEVVNLNSEKKFTGTWYWLASSLEDDSRQLRCVTPSEVGATNEYCFGIRPVITMTDGVYIVSGYGTEESPYILGKD